MATCNDKPHPFRRARTLGHSIIITLSLSLSMEKFCRNAENQRMRGLPLSPLIEGVGVLPEGVGRVDGPLQSAYGIAPCRRTWQGLAERQAHGDNRRRLKMATVCARLRLIRPQRAVDLAPKGRSNKAQANGP
jgi:hypothetical protein